MSEYIWLGWYGQPFPANCSFDDEAYYILYYLNKPLIFFVGKEDVTKSEWINEREVILYMDKGSWTQITPPKWAVESWNKYVASSQPGA